MHQKVKVLIHLIYAERRQFLKNQIKNMFDHDLVFSCLHLLFPKNNINHLFCYKKFSAMGPCFLFVLVHLFCLSHRKTCWTRSVDNVVLNNTSLKTSNSIVTMTFFSLGVNWSDIGTNSPTNHKFYRALGWSLHGAWCKPPLTIGPKPWPS